MNILLQVIAFLMINYLLTLWHGSLNLFRVMRFEKNKNYGLANFDFGFGYHLKKRGGEITLQFFYVRPRWKVRFKAIRCALYYGILPWQWYEKEKHYEYSYFEHLLINLLYALKWLTFNESPWSLRFEKNTNENY